MKTRLRTLRQNRTACLAARCVAALLGSAPLAAAPVSEIQLLNASDPAQRLLLKNASALEESLHQFSGQPDSASLRESIADAVLAHYQAAGWPVVDVAVERPRSGILAVNVSEGRWGEISVAGGSGRSKRAAFKDWSRLRGQPLTSESMAEQLAWLHRNPLIAGAVSFLPGAETATADAMLTLMNTRPFRFSAGYRDDGSPPLSRERFFAAVEAADVLGLPSWWNAEVSSGTDRDEYFSARSALRLFLLSHHELRLSAAWSQASSTSALLPGFDAVSDYEAWNMSARLVSPLTPWRGWNSEWSIGADFTRLSTEVTLLGFGTAGEADSLHLTAGFHAERKDEAWRSGVDADISWSPGGITSSADDDDHEALRRGASSSYTHIRAGAYLEHDLPGGWTASARTSGQWSSDPVIPTQAFSPAGTAGVRGFPASSVLGDSGVQGSLELLTPPLPVPDSWKGLSVKAAAFVDAAWVYDDAANDGTTLASAGAGLKLQWRHNLGMAVQYGERLTESGGRLHVAVRVEF